MQPRSFDPSFFQILGMFIAIVVIILPPITIGWALVGGALLAVNIAFSFKSDHRS